MRAAVSLCLSLASALALGMLSSPSAHAAGCGTLSLPTALTDFVGPGASGQSGGAPIGQACFDLHAPAGELLVTTRDNMTVGWSGPDATPFFDTNLGITAVSFRSPTGSLLAPQSKDPIIDSLPDWPHGTLTWTAGQVWHFNLPAGGDYVMTLDMSGSSLSSLYSLGVSAVPEPASATLWALGLACLLVAARRRQAASEPRCISPESSTRTPLARGTRASRAAATLAASIG